MQCLAPGRMGDARLPSILCEREPFRSGATFLGAAGWFCQRARPASGRAAPRKCQRKPLNSLGLALATYPPLIFILGTYYRKKPPHFRQCPHNAPASFHNIISLFRVPFDAFDILFHVSNPAHQLLKFGLIDQCWFGHFMAFSTAWMKDPTSSRSSALWLVRANCVGSFVINRLSALITLSKSCKAKLVGGGFAGVGGTAGDGPSRIAVISGSSEAVVSPPFS